MSPVDLARQHAERIAALDDAGPQINAVIAYDPQPQDEARAAQSVGLLNGRTVLVKDNVETAEWPTTAGSLALKGNTTGRDAPLIANLRAAGGVVLGKTNLSEWANIRSNNSTSGWSAVGGLTKNPYATDRNTCGSSSGSGAAIAAGLPGVRSDRTHGSISARRASTGSSASNPVSVSLAAPMWCRFLQRRIPPDR